ncbi:MAG: serine/threonine protein kinase [Planctomycetota bacterium]
MAEPDLEAAIDDWDEIQEVFREARQRPPGERSGYLDEVCRGDAARRALLEKLLHHDDMVPSAWLLPSVDPDVTSSVPPRQDSEATSSEPSPTRQTISGRWIGCYEIRCLIASGGMGDVYEALQDKPSRIVAIKLMKPGFDMERFEGEWDTLGRLRHPGIAQVYSAGVQDSADGPIPFFAMEYVPNAGSITQYAEAWNLSVHERLELFAKVCDAVQAAHQKGIVHRDLKPGNILVDTEGQPKIIDFGVAWAADRVAAEHLGQVCGTMVYMSPEQLAGDPYDLDARSDVYSLGIVLYELLCRQRPYADVSPEKIRTDQPPPPSRLNPELNGRVDQIVLKALAKRRHRRYRNAADLGDELRRYLDDEPATTGRQPEPASPPTRRKKAGSRIGPFVHIFVILSVVAAAASIMIPLTSEQEPAPTPQPLPQVGVQISLRNEEGPIDPASKTVGGDITPWVQAEREGVFYLFRVGVRGVVPMECAEECQYRHYAPDGQVQAGCVYYESNDDPGDYCLFAILLTGIDRRICDLVENDVGLAAVNPLDETAVKNELSRILGEREDLLGYAASSFSRR